MLSELVIDCVSGYVSALLKLAGGFCCWHGTLLECVEGQSPSQGGGHIGWKRGIRFVVQKLDSLTGNEKFGAIHVLEVVQPKKNMLLLFVMSYIQLFIDMYIYVITR